MNDKTRSTSPRQLILTAAGIAALAAATWLPGMLQQNALQGDIQLPVPGCEITEAGCNTQQDELSMQLQLSTDQPRSAEPLSFQLELGNIPASAVMIDLQGRDMYMGVNQAQMSPVEGKPGLWQVTTELPICVTGEMVWQAKVHAMTDNASVSTTFEFKAR